MGRPTKHGSGPMVDRLEIRLDPGEKAAYVAAAQAAGLPLSDWIRAMLNAAIKRQLRARKGRG